LAGPVEDLWKLWIRWKERCPKRAAGCRRRHAGIGVYGRFDLVAAP
jgi:hypothetical protein